MKHFYLFLVLLIMATSMVHAQVGINADNSAPDPSAGLDVKFPDKGFLPPRMTIEQRNALAGPAEGLMIFCTDCGVNGSFCVFSNGAWRTFIQCKTPPSSPAPNSIPPGQITWKWRAVPGAFGYKWNTTPNYSSATDLGTDTTKTETGINCGTTYTHYVWVYNKCGISVPVTLSQTIPASAPVSPSAGTHIPGTATIMWKWNTVSNATGYRWNTTDDFSTATEMGTATTKSESGLECSTNYTRFVWAYNGCASSASAALTQKTNGCPVVCGSSFTISHQTSGGVAPVDKTVTYGTVNGIPGELAQCWITRNLGASQQATAVSDNTEASAGWYFQFNRKQGYKHTGSTRTPNSTWINYINENQDWSIANDPCNIELGTPWRIPTYSEWYYVDFVNIWTNWTGPWNSGLKLHAAGNLDVSDGSLLNRGLSGSYWSVKQASNIHGWILYFFATLSLPSDCDKRAANTVRCIRDY